MKVKLLVGRCGDGIDQQPGQVIDVPKKEALALLNGGTAEPVSTERRIETATLDRTAAQGRRRKGTRNATTK